MTVRGREIRRISALLLLSLLSAAFLAGCLGASQADWSAEASAGTGSGSPGETPKKSTSGGVPESTVGASHIEGDLAETNDASSRVPFVEKTEDSGGLGYDADTVLALRYGVHGDYERAVIDLGTGEEPTGTVPEWTLTSPEGDGLLRVDLPSASATYVSDGKFGEGLLGSFHVVRAPDGGMFVDFFARKPFRYRVLGLQDPARLIVDFEPAGGDSYVPPPAQGGDTVLVEPRPNSVISDPLTVSGYSRNPEAANAITLTGPHGKVLVRKTVRSNDWSHTWGYFEATIDLPPFSGQGTLKIGAGSVRDGTFEGVEIPIRAGR
jgi:Immunoglobulin-like domain of bacterial spore germination